MIIGGFIMSLLSVIIPVGLVVLLIYLIYKRLKDKEKEDFEKRDY
ncbi:MAG TPA: hypothetical protein P5050_05050 [Bacteroidia bacterium]|nr:hypothetical protein [Bacteroidia bacterium]HRS58570.1 hypothetical protein [Bacteroidia bacterium]HRU68412.1 hypothetical protein [Bacteroidia bacterium]